MPPARFATWSKPALPQQHRGLRRARARAAHGDHRPVAVELAGARRQLAQRHQPRAGMWPSGPLNSSGSRTSTTCTRAARHLVQRVRLDLPHAGEGAASAAPTPGSAARRRLAFGLAAAQVGRHRDVHLLRVRQAEVVHVAGEVGLADLAAQARVVAPLLGDAGDGEAAVVVGRVEQAGVAAA